MKAMFSALLAVAIALSAWAASPASGSPASGVTRAADIPQAIEESAVVLEGCLGRQVGEERYVFQDDSGEVEVEMDADLVRESPVAPGIRVRVRGVVEKDGRTPHVEAEAVERLEPPVQGGGM